MLASKRVFISTLCGIVFGFICLGLAASNPEGSNELSRLVQWNIVISRGLMGFMIGISALKLSWWLHGITIGIISSIPMAIAVMDRIEIAIGTIVMGIIYGFLTELITSVVFKSKSVALS